tara:strand:+ start:869 stop:1141 length:273 start_codon:yes stop_codon:yes gene_type:complete
MKIFVTKIIIASLSIYILFELTLGSRIDNLTNHLNKFQSKVEREKTLEKILVEIEKANKKEYILDERERIIISNFIKKLNKELKSSINKN